MRRYKLRKVDPGLTPPISLNKSVDEIHNLWYIPFVNKIFLTLPFLLSELVDLNCLEERRVADDFQSMVVQKCFIPLEN